MGEDTYSGRRLDAKVVTRGTHRARTLAQTWATVRPWLGRMGITRVANVTGLDDLGIPVTMVCRPNARSLSVAQGKGLTLDAARVSGVMEAAEHFHAEEADVPVHEASPNALAGPAVEIDRLPRPPGVDLDRDRPLRWTAGAGLVSGERRWVPFECVQLGRIRPSDRTFAMTSSGLACGNTADEALSHALCELVERHAQAIWRGLPLTLKATTRVELDTVTDPACRTMIARCASAGVAIGVWSLMSEIELPAFTCLLAQRTSRHPRALPPAYGSGCHPDRAVALARAITEAAQSRLTHIAGVRDDMTDEPYGLMTQSPTIGRALELIEAGPGRPFELTPTHPSDRVSADVARELGALERASIPEPVAVDLTRAELGLHVVRVIVPGLESAAAGRVPASTGVRA